MEAKTCVSKSEKESGINAELFDARNQCSPVDCHTHRSTVCASNPTLCLVHGAHDLLPLRFVILFGCASRSYLLDFTVLRSHNPGNLVFLTFWVLNGVLHSQC